MTHRVETYLYEILVRFGPDGYAGSHVVDLVRTIDEASGELVGEATTKARPLTSEEVGELIGFKNAELIQQLDAVRKDHADAERRLAETEADLTAQLNTERSAREAAEKRLERLAAVMAG